MVQTKRNKLIRKLNQIRKLAEFLNSMMKRMIEGERELRRFESGVIYPREEINCLLGMDKRGTVEKETIEITN